MYVFLLILGSAIVGFGWYLADSKGKKLIGYILIAVGLLIVVLVFPYLPNWIVGALSGSFY